MYHIYRDMRFERLASISNGHIYNLRKTRTYRTGHLTFRKTRPAPVSIGVRRKPRPDGQPGFLRVDTVHLGDHGGEKGIYLINIVNEVTQFQHLGAVPRITQQFLVPRLEALLSAFPFTIHAFHADSEYVNRFVADLLNKLHVPTFTKSRPRHCNDNSCVLLTEFVQFVRIRNRRMSETMRSGGFSSASAYCLNWSNAASRLACFPLYSQAKQ